MKLFKIIILLLITLITSLNVYSQNVFKEAPSDSVYLIKVKNIYGNTKYEVSRNLVISNKDKTTGISMNIRMSYGMELLAISGTLLNIGKGYGYEELVIYFKNGDRLYFTNTLASNEVAFYIPEKFKEHYINLLRTQPVVKVKISYFGKGITEKLTGMDQRYFIQLLYASYNGLYRKQ